MFIGYSHQDTPPLVVNLMLYFFNAKPVKVVVAFFNFLSTRKSSPPSSMWIINYHTYHRICPVDIGSTLNKAFPNSHDILNLVTKERYPWEQ